MKPRCFIISIIFFVYVQIVVSAQIHFPVSSPNAVKEIFHQYNPPLLQIGIRSYGDVAAIISGTVVFVSDTIVEIRSTKDMRVIYIGIRPTVFIGAQVFAGDTIAKSNDRDPWYMRIRDTVHNIWIDPLRIFPQILEEKRILMRLIDFEFAYESQERTKQQDVRVIQRIMPSGRFRAIVMATLRDIHSEKFLLPVHIVVRIGSHHFTFTQEELFAYAQQDDDVVTIEDNQVRLFLPELTLSRGYYTASISVHGPLGTHKAFSFSFFAR